MNVPHLEDFLILDFPESFGAYGFSFDWRK
jgi:hypothetical protein